MGQMRKSFVASLLAGAGVLLVAAPSAQALTAYTDVLGPYVNFTGIQESSSYGDPEPLFDQPVGGLDSLLFFPPNFNANSAGGGIDSTGSQLQLLISTSNPLATIDQVLIEEFGDATLLGFGGASTGAQITMSGFLTVQETLSGPIAPVVIPWVGVFTQDLFLLPGDSGVTIWSGSALIDVASVVPNATKAFLSFDNDMFAASEASTSSKIQKKVVDGPAVIITVIPEPSTFALLGGALAALSIRARGRRR